MRSDPLFEFSVIASGVFHGVGDVLVGPTVDALSAVGYGAGGIGASVARNPFDDGWIERHSTEISTDDARTLVQLPETYQARFLEMPTVDQLSQRIVELAARLRVFAPDIVLCPLRGGAKIGLFTELITGHRNVVPLSFTRGAAEQSSPAVVSQLKKALMGVGYS